MKKINMKIYKKVIEAVDWKYLIIRVKLRGHEGDELITDEFFELEDENLNICIDVDKRKIINYKGNKPFNLHLKAVDSGTYVFKDCYGNIFYTLQDYVPNGIIPGAYGDYIELNIDDCGFITNWKKTLYLDDLDGLGLTNDELKYE